MVERSRLSCVGSVLHARGAVTEKAVSLIRRRVGSTTRSSDDQARSADRATDVSKRAMCERRVSSKRLVDLQAQLVLDWTLRLVVSATAGQPGHTVAQNSTCRAGGGVYIGLTHCSGVNVEAGRSASTALQ